jgi:signal transduction histidine kinase/ligand-binding sensor domain-containing protein/DNA-binding response OmpR family regulator
MGMHTRILFTWSVNFLLGLVLFETQAAAAVSTDFNYHIRYLTIDQGLSQNTVHAIERDSRGWMWFGTGNGLSRFDGYSFVNFHKPAIPSNLVNALVETADRRLWIGTSGGLAYLNLATGDISTFHLLDATGNPVNVISLYVSQNGCVMVGSLEQGFFVLCPTDEGYRTLHFDSSNSALSGNHVSSFLQMSDGRLLVGTNHGIVVYDFQREVVYPYNHGNLEGALILSLFESNDGDLWVGTFNGVWVFNPATRRNEWFFHEPLNEGGLSHGRVNDIVQDFKGTIYLATLGGVDVYQPKTNSFRAFPVRKVAGFSLNSMFINVVFIDEEGNVWIGTEKGGVNQFSLYQKPFDYYVHQINNSNSLSHATVNSILSDSTSLWIGTAGGGLNHLDRQTGRFKCFNQDPANSYSLPGDFVTTLAFDDRHNLWVGTWGAGLAKMLPDGRFKRFLVPVANPETNYENSFISCVLFDGANDCLFIGTEGGLAVLDLKSESFLKIDDENPLSAINEIGWLIKDRENDVWVATRNGLYYFRADQDFRLGDTLCRNTQVNVLKRNEASDSIGLRGNYSTYLLEDAAGNIWVGTYGDGLFKISKEADHFKFQCYSVDQGLSNNVVYAIQEDEAGFIWASTDYGLSRLNPENGFIDTYFSDDGLLSDQFYWAASYKSDEGELFFGSVNGLNHFYPSRFPVYPYQPDVEISSLRIFNEPVGVGERRHGKVVLSAPISEMKEISLSFQDNVLSLEFSALDYFNPRKTRYAYQLEGVDRNWVEVPSDHRIVTYTNLKGGSYLFRVKAANSEGTWSSSEKHLVITVRPPFWQTTWFMVVLILVIVVVSAIYIRHHTKRLILEKSKLESMVKDRTRTIAQQRDQMGLQAGELQVANDRLKRRGDLIEGQKKELEAKNQEISEQRDRLVELNQEIERINQNRMHFYTNISHEFRTPLTLIISPVDRLMNEMKLPDAAREMLKTVQRNARRLNLLIDQLLFFRKIETGNLSVRLSNKDINSFVADVFHAFDELAAQRDIKYLLKTDVGDALCWTDTNKLENILYNLISNAFKYTPSGGSVTVKVALTAVAHEGSADPVLNIQVADSGVGIDQAQIGKIFNRFFRSANGSNIKGSGIGLSLTRELVEVLNGHIDVESNPHQGSCFTVTIPCRKEDFPGAEINEMPAFSNTDLTEKVQVIIDSMTDNEPFLADLDSGSNEPLILVVEDNKELALFIANSLTGIYRVLLAADGKEGYNIARKNSPDIIVSDVMMPVMDGVEMCRQLKSNLYTSHIPVILLSAKALLEDQMAGVRVGADDYIPKPFNLELLRAKLHNMIETRRKMKMIFTSENEVTIPKSGKVASIDEKFLTKSYEIMEAFYSNPEFSVELFAEQMFVSRSLLYKKLKALVNLSPNDFITIYRLKKSLPLLAAKNRSINEVAYSIGFNDPKYFSRVFKKFYQKTPSEYLDAV